MKIIFFIAGFFFFPLQANFFNDAYVLADGTISFEQPPSTGYLGWEGKCFQTAAANVCTMLAEDGQAISPQKVDKLIVPDITPGTHPVNAINFMQAYCAGRWQYVRTSPENALLDLKNSLYDRQLKAANNRSPVIILLTWDHTLTSMHWVTVVDIDDQNVVINHWGGQQILTHNDFLDKWSFAKIPGAEESAEFINEFSWIMINQKSDSY